MKEKDKDVIETLVSAIAELITVIERQQEQIRLLRARVAISELLGR